MRPFRRLTVSEGLPSSPHCVTVIADGQFWNAGSVHEIMDFLRDAGDSFVLVWRGQYRSDVFFVDSREVCDALIDAWRPFAKGWTR